MSGLGTLLSGLLSVTSVSMTSEFDASLSVGDTTSTPFKIITYEDSMKLLNNSQGYSNYVIYGLDGKVISKSDKISPLNSINISSLKRGVYILKLRSSNKDMTYKFIKA